ncbi:ACT domain-containing protein, partial [Salmonella enterica subsp. enterica serovar Anatum]|nr:ACT domain-containing protein [Salmonella enterica subsp. enterica serovar Anatum]
PGCNCETAYSLPVLLQQLRRKPEAILILCLRPREHLFLFYSLIGISAKFFAALARANINIVAIAQGSSERSISVVVNNDDATTGV